MTTTDTFLDLYKQLEHVGKNVYYPKASDSDNIIGRLLNHPHLAEFKDELNYCRVVRNFLTHNPRVNGFYPIEVSESMVLVLQKIIKCIENPPTALEFATKRKDMLILKRDSFVTDALKKLHEKAYTHAPIIERGKLVGVFGIDSIRLCITTEGGILIDEETIINDLIEYCKLQAHDDMLIYFVSSNTPISIVEDIFEDNYNNGHLISVVYITETGKMNESILGMITPWDLITKS